MMRAVCSSLAGACVLTLPARACLGLYAVCAGARASAQRLPRRVRGRRRWHGGSGEVGLRAADLLAQAGGVAAAYDDGR